MNCSHSHSRGVALIMALLVVAIATVAATALSQRVALDTRRSASMIDGDQAWMYAEGAEGWTKSILARDLRAGQIDHLLEPWAQNLPPLELPGGNIIGKISDMQGLININGLYQAGVEDGKALIRFQRLLISQGLDPDLTLAIIDWLDPDIEPKRPSGAEDDYYIGLDPPYLAANQPMRSPTELRLVKGFDQKTYEKIIPFVTALPGHTTININTAPAEVIATMAPNGSLETATSIVEERTEKPFETISEFSQNPLVQSLGIDDTDIGITSQYFMLHSDVHVGQGRAKLDSLIFRESVNKQTVIYRSSAG